MFLFYSAQSHMGFPMGPNPQLAMMGSSHPSMIPPTSNAMMQQVPTQPKEKMNIAFEFLDRVKNVYHNQPEVYNQFLDIMKDFKHHRCVAHFSIIRVNCLTFSSIDTTGVIERVKTLFVGNPSLVEGFNQFLPPPLKIHHTEPPKETKPPTEDTEHRKEDVDQARSYVKKIKQRFHSQPHIYKAFLDILHTFSKEQQSTQDIYAKVSRLFKDHDDLLREFSNFLPDTSAGEEVEEPNIPKLRPTRSRTTSTLESKSQTAKSIDVKPGSCGTFREIQVFLKIKRYLGSSYSDFLKLVSLYNQLVISKKELYVLAKGLLRKCEDQNLLLDLSSFIGVDPSDANLEMEMEEEDNAEEQDEEPFENPYEELLFNCENHLNELDYAINTNLSSLQYFEDLLSAYDSLSEENKQTYRVGELDPLYLESIRLLYKKRGDQIIRNLQMSRNIKIIRIFVDRMKKKEKEWNESRSEWQNLRDKIYVRYSRNYFNHQSGKFKEEEKKRLKPDSLLEELKFPEVQLPKNPIVTNVQIQEPIVNEMKHLLKSVIHTDMNGSLTESTVESSIAFVVGKLFQMEESTDKLDLDNEKPSYDLFFGTSDFYLLFRYFGIVQRILAEAKKLSSVSDDEEVTPEQQKKTYEEFIQWTEQLIQKKINAATFEDHCFNALGSLSYTLFNVHESLMYLAEYLGKLSNETNQKIVDAFVKRESLTKYAQQVATIEANEWYMFCVQSKNLVVFGKGLERFAEEPVEEQEVSTPQETSPQPSEEPPMHEESKNVEEPMDIDLHSENPTDQKTTFEPEEEKEQIQRGVEPEGKDETMTQAEPTGAKPNVPISDQPVVNENPALVENKTEPEPIQNIEPMKEEVSEPVEEKQEETGPIGNVDISHEAKIEERSETIEEPKNE